MRKMPFDPEWSLLDEIQHESLKGRYFYDFDGDKTPCYRKVIVLMRKMQSEVPDFKEPWLVVLRSIKDV